MNAAAGGGGGGEGAEAEVAATMLSRGDRRIFQFSCCHIDVLSAVAVACCQLSVLLSRSCSLSLSLSLRVCSDACCRLHRAGRQAGANGMSAVNIYAAQCSLSLSQLAKGDDVSFLTAAEFVACLLLLLRRLKPWQSQLICGCHKL